MIVRVDDVFMKDLIDNTHCHIDGTVHAHKDGGKAHNHFEQEGLEQRQNASLLLTLFYHIFGKILG